MKQLVFLKQNYEITSLSEINQVSNNHRVVLTFDDGYLDNYSDVASILIDQNIPGTFFISPFFIEHNFYFYTDAIAYLIDLNLYEKFFNTYYFKKWRFKHNQDEIKQISLKSNQFITDFIININNFIQFNSIANLPSPMNLSQIYKLSEERLFALGHHTYLHSRFNKNRTTDF